MKLAVSIIALVLLGTAAAQTAEKIKCLLGVQIDETAVTGRQLQMAPVSAPKSVSDLLVLYEYLSAEAKAKIAACQLNLSPALARCEAQHGAGACELNGLYAQKKCPAGSKRFGCCVCASECPAGFDEKGYYCMKPLAQKSAQFSTKEECTTIAKAVCERWVLEFWVPVCSAGFRRVGADQCVPMCPDGWQDSGRICFKPIASRLAAPYTWIPSDN